MKKSAPAVGFVMPFTASIMTDHDSHSCGTCAACAGGGTRGIHPTDDPAAGDRGLGGLGADAAAQRAMAALSGIGPQRIPCD